jgi:hypothetical protein
MILSPFDEERSIKINTHCGMRAKIPSQFSLSVFNTAANKNVAGERTTCRSIKVKTGEMYSSKVHTLSYYECRDFEQSIGLDVVFALINVKYSRRHLKIKKNDRGHAVKQLDEALRYKPESSGFDSRRGHWNFSLN